MVSVTGTRVHALVTPLLTVAKNNDSALDAFAPLRQLSRDVGLNHRGSDYKGMTNCSQSIVLPE